MKHLLTTIILLLALQTQAQNATKITAENIIGQHREAIHCTVNMHASEVNFFPNGDFLYMPYFDSNKGGNEFPRPSIKGNWKVENDTLYLVPTDKKLKTAKLATFPSDNLYLMPGFLTNFWAFEIRGTWEVVHHLQDKKVELVRQTEKQYSIEAITFFDDSTFVHQRTPPCGLDVFFTKKGRYCYTDRGMLALSYVGGEKYKDNSGSPFSDCKGTCITKKEELFFNYYRKNSDTTQLLNILFGTEQKEVTDENILKERKKDKNGYIRGRIGKQKIWFNVSENSEEWKKEIQERKKDNYNNKKIDEIALIKGDEYYAMYSVYPKNLSDEPKKEVKNDFNLTNHSEQYYTVMLLKDCAQDLSEMTIEMNYRHRLKDGNSLGSIFTCDKTIFQNIQLKNGYLSGKIIGQMRYELMHEIYADVDIEFRIKLEKFK